MESGRERFEKRQIDLAMLSWQRKYYELAKWQKWSAVVIAIATVVNVVIAFIKF